MAPVVAEVALEYQDTFSVAKLNNDENRQTIAKYRIIGQPIYIVFKDGKAIKSFKGAMPKAQFIQNVLNAINN